MRGAGVVRGDLAARPQRGGRGSGRPGNGRRPRRGRSRPRRPCMALTPRPRRAPRGSASSLNPRPTSATNTSSRVGSDLRSARICDPRRRAHTTPPSAPSSSSTRLSAIAACSGSDRPRPGAAETTPGSRASDSGTAVEMVDLEAEDRLALDAPLQLVGRADREDAAAVDDRDPLAQLVGLGHVVGREEDGPTRAPRRASRDELADLASRGDIEAERRLVEEQDPRVVEQAAGHVHLLPLAGGQRLTPSGALLLEPDRLDELVDAAPAPRASQAVELAEHPELLADLEDPVARLLAARDHVHDPADALRLLAHVEPEDPGASPEVGGSSVVRILMSVVLPAPFGPSSPKNSPVATSRSTPASADDRVGLDVVDAANVAARRWRAASGRAGVDGHAAARRGRLRDAESTIGPARWKRLVFTPGRWTSNRRPGVHRTPVRAVAV